MFYKPVINKFREMGKEDDLERIKEAFNEHEARYIQRIKPLPSKPSRLLGQNGLHYIQLSLFRSKALLEGVVTSVNSGNGLLAMLATRAHFETTGGLSCFFKKLRSFYDSVITYEELDKALFKLILGTRAGEIEKVTESFNVLTMIDTVDEYFTHISPRRVQTFRKTYELLSEYCHPNFSGITIGAQWEKNIGIVGFKQSLELLNEDLAVSSYLLISTTAFLRFYDMCFSLLSENEELPIIVGNNAHTTNAT